MLRIFLALGSPLVKETAWPRIDFRFRPVVLRQLDISVPTPASSSKLLCDITQFIPVAIVSSDQGKSSRSIQPKPTLISPKTAGRPIAPRPTINPAA